MIVVMKDIQKDEYRKQLNSLLDIANKKGKSAAIFNLGQNPWWKETMPRTSGTDRSSNRKRSDNTGGNQKSFAGVLCQSPEEKDT